MVPCLQRDQQQEWGAEPLQTDVPIKTKHKLHKQREPRQQQDPPGHCGSITQSRVLPHHPPKLQPPKMQTLIPQPQTTAQLS